ncbi:MmcQ/YjbR family DNA-binding protein [Nocardioides sp.]|uniref:MmcQ/YjbR family DNA-binding protein n=1 Tax=Nocardioides sp. TaxID=35761 RepID=UPI003D12F2BB
MAEPLLVPVEILETLSAICLALPEVYEEPAWIGMRWRIRTRTIAHVATIDLDAPGAFARAVDATGIVTTMTFRAPEEELEVLAQLGHPFYRPGWGANVVGLLLDASTDWTEVAELVTDSFRIQAPKRLAARLDESAQ